MVAIEQVERGADGVVGADDGGVGAHHLLDRSDAGHTRREAGLDEVAFAEDADGAPVADDDEAADILAAEQIDGLTQQPVSFDLHRGPFDQRGDGRGVEGRVDRRHRVAPLAWAGRPRGLPCLSHAGIVP